MIEYFNSLVKLEFDKILSRVRTLSATELGQSSITNLKPLSALADIQGALRQVTEMKHLLESDATPPFEGIIDCRPFVKKAAIQDNVLSASELRSIGNLLTGAKNLKKYCNQRKDRIPTLDTLVLDLQIDYLLESHINNAIDQNNEVIDTASKELKRIRHLIRKLYEDLRKHFRVILQKYAKEDWVQDEIITLRDGRLVIPVKMEHKNHIPGFIHNTSISGLTAFIEPAETLELNNGILSLRLEEQREIESILRDLTRQVYSQSEELNQNLLRIT